VLAVIERLNVEEGDIWVLPLRGERKPRPFLQTQFKEAGAVFSPDGHWLAYTSNESGRFEVYVQPFPGPGGKWQISTAGGDQPVWARNGRELFYREGNKMMAVEVTTRPSFSTGTPTSLFAGQYVHRSSLRPADYDISPDGGRFLMVQASPQGPSANQINVVLNWFEELKARVGPGPGGRP
jgi:eukaryotic-like serine/threonine-protein kinase